MPYSSSRPRTPGFHPGNRGFESPIRYKKKSAISIADFFILNYDRNKPILQLRHHSHSAGSWRTPLGTKSTPLEHAVRDSPCKLPLFYGQFNYYYYGDNTCPSFFFISLFKNSNKSVICNNDSEKNKYLTISILHFFL